MVLKISERTITEVRMGKSGPLERTRLANQIQGFRISGHLEARQNNTRFSISYKTTNKVSSVSGFFVIKGTLYHVHVAGTNDINFLTFQFLKSKL